jgi:FtsP/CotA-like multicopper oxidase with cupredoxin domain
VWTFRNGGRNWSHPIHSHFVEFIMLEVNGRPHRRDVVQDVAGRTMDLESYLGRPPAERRPIGAFMGGQRRDVAILLPGDEVKVFMRWPDFLGKYVMHCHNVVHEDHAMMIRWDIVEPGQGSDSPRSAAELYGSGPPHLEVRPGSATIQDGAAAGPPDGPDREERP